MSNEQELQPLSDPHQPEGLVVPQPESPGDALAARSDVPRPLQPGEVEQAEQTIKDDPEGSMTTRIPVTDASEGFPMAASVTPLESVEHIPGVNAPYGDPDHVDSNSRTTESNVPKAYEMADSAKDLRDGATTERQWSQKGDEDNSAAHSRHAFELDEDAAQIEAQAGRQYDVEHPSESRPKIELSKEAVDQVEEHLKEVQRIIDEAKGGQVS